ncbi:MAG: triose-phosphate isomerase family protein [Minisyncoccota bacterium]
MKLILIGNWKNHPSSLKETTSLLNNLSKRSKSFKKLATFIAVPLSYIESASKKIGKFASLGSQDIFFTDGGTYTGVVTPDILKSFGVKLAIVGHSERRLLGESNQVVAEKAKTALKAGIIPVVCVGEADHDAEGNYFEFLREQLRASLEGVRRKDDAHKLIIAYEPIWAIGKKGKGAMDPLELSQMVIFIKKVLTETFGRDLADKIPILYGGSVDPLNAERLIKETGIRGLLVGRASLDAKNFAEIAEAITK